MTPAEDWLTPRKRPDSAYFEGFGRVNAWDAEGVPCIHPNREVGWHRGVLHGRLTMSAIRKPPLQIYYSFSMFVGAVFCLYNKNIMERTLINTLKNNLETTVLIQGSVHVARNQGKVAFFDFRDRTGLVQGVIFGKPELLEATKSLRPESIVSVTGIVHARPEKMINANVQNGDLELEITAVEILSLAEGLPFDMNTRSEERRVGKECRL